MKRFAIAILAFYLASGPTIPPGPWDDDDDTSGGTKIAFIETGGVIT